MSSAPQMLALNGTTTTSAAAAGWCGIPGKGVAKMSRRNPWQLAVRCPTRSDTHTSGLKPGVSVEDRPKAQTQRTFSATALGNICIWECSLLPNREYSSNTISKLKGLSLIWSRCDIAINSDKSSRDMSAQHVSHAGTISSTITTSMVTRRPTNLGPTCTRDPTPLTHTLSPNLLPSKMGPLVYSTRPTHGRTIDRTSARIGLP